MKSVLLVFAAAACLVLNGCAASSTQAESYEHLTQPTGSPAPSGGSSAATGPIGAAYDLAATAVGAAAVPGYLDKSPAQPSYLTDANPEPYPR
jgi:hypothetical protein